MHDDPVSHPAPVPPDGNALGWRHIGPWFVPWLIGVLLAISFLIGLVAASRATDDTLYAIGFILAGASLLGLGWVAQAGLAGRMPSVLVETPASLVLLLAGLSVLAVIGLGLAARAADSTVQSVGYALFIVALALAGWNLRHYWDMRDRGR